MLQEVTRLRFFFFEPFNEVLISTCSFNLVNTVEPISPPSSNTEAVAGPTRLELATSCVTGMRSNQLNYDPAQKTYPGR